MSQSWRFKSVSLFVLILVLSNSHARADALQASGHFFFTTMEKRYAGTDRLYKKSGNTLEQSNQDNGELYKRTITQVNRCTYRFEFMRPPSIATRSTSMQIDFSGFKRENMSQSKAGKAGYDAVKITGIRACNVGEHLEYWNTHIAPGSCSDTFYQMIFDYPEKQRMGLNEMIDYCKKKK